MLNYVILFSYINADIMENKAKKVQEKATTFFRNSLQYYGKEIADNPNALSMLDFANNDLGKAEVLGECYLMVPEGSKKIPITNSKSKYLNKER